MRRTLTIATFFLLCAPALLAQGRFHGTPPSVTSMGPGGFRGIPPSVTSIGSPRFVGSPGFVGARHFGGTSVFFGGSFGFVPNRFGVVFIHGHRHFFPAFSTFGFFGAPFFPSWGFPSWGYAYPPYYSYPQQPVAYQAAPEEYNRGNDALVGEIQRLREDVDRLREERYDRERVPQPPRSEAKPEAPQPATVLVFRDGKRVETSNYAIAGQTLWIFSEQRARKVPLADLDLEATRALNEEHGVEFNGGRR